MRRTSRHLLLILATAAATTACGGDGLGIRGRQAGQNPASPNFPEQNAYGVFGDWFFCTTSACNVLEDQGVRFRDDGVWIALEAPGRLLEPDETYCPDGVGGRFEELIEQDGLHLLLSGVDDGSLLLDWHETGEPDRVLIRLLDRVVGARRITPSRIAPDCEDQGDPLPIPVPAPGGTRAPGDDAPSAGDG